MNRRVSLLLQTLGNDYQELLRDDALTTSRRLGLETTILSADRSAERQAQQVRDLLKQPPSQRPAAVIISPVRETALMAAAHEAARSGLGWVVLSRWSEYLAEQRALFPNVPLFCVMPDQEEIGRIQARQVKALLPEGLELVYIRGPLGTYSAERRLAGFREVFGSDGAVEPFLLNSDWSVDGGAQAMGDWIRIFTKKQLPSCLVAAQNDAMAMGALKAYTAHAGHQRTPPTFIGCDGSPGYGQRLIGSGELRATVLIPSVTGLALSELSRALTSGIAPKLVNLVPVQSIPDLQKLGDATANRST
ncbi:MAG: substrate-binding domain-containing protein [Polyangiaceae bacterium]